jgi:hypothetical protein
MQARLSCALACLSLPLLASVGAQAQADDLLPDGQVPMVWGPAPAQSLTAAAPASAASPLPALPDPGLSPAHGGVSKLRVLFNDKQLSFENALEAVPESTRETLRYWRVWAEEHEFDLAVDATGRMVLLSTSWSKLKTWLKLAEEAAERVDELAPLPADRLIDRILPDSGPTPLAGEPPAALPAGSEDGTDPGLPANIGLPPYEQHPVVLFHLTDQAQQLSILERLAFDHEHIKTWLAQGVSRPGFCVEWPHVGAWMETPVNEEWSAEAELVHRVAQLLTVRRFGHLPYWLRIGLAWKVEWDLIGGIYCFPYRSGFVYATEHESWPNDLAKMYADRKDYPLQPSELDDWPRETFRAEFAQRAFGFVSFLADNFPAALPALLEAARREFERGSLKSAPAGSWRRDLEHDVSARRLLEHLAALTRPDVVEELTTYLRKGMKHKVK